MAIDNALSPEFSDPPVVEVAFSLQFAALPSLNSGHLAIWWEQLKSDYPKIEEQTPLPPFLEQFGPRPAPQSVQIIVSAPGVGGQQPRWPGSRYWFVTERGDRLIQVQTDRLTYNWRRLEGADGTYPRYGAVRKAFRQVLQKFRLFLREGRFGELEPTQCELTYVNHLAIGKGWDRFGEIGEVFPVCVPNPPGGQLPEPEDGSFQFRYPIKHESGEQAGRLYVSAQPALRADGGTSILLLQIAARGRPPGAPDESIFSFFDQGHDLAVRAFLAVTAERMHRLWGRKDAR